MHECWMRQMHSQRSKQRCWLQGTGGMRTCFCRHWFLGDGESEGAELLDEGVAQLHHLQQATGFHKGLIPLQMDQTTRCLLRCITNIHITLHLRTSKQWRLTRRKPALKHDISSRGDVRALKILDRVASEEKR